MFEVTLAIFSHADANPYDHPTPSLYVSLNAPEYFPYLESLPVLKDQLLRFPLLETLYKNAIKYTKFSSIFPPEDNSAFVDAIFPSIIVNLIPLDILLILLLYNEKLH